MGNDFEVVGRIVVDSSGAVAIEGVNSSLGKMQEKAGALHGISQSLGQAWSYVWGNLIYGAISKATQAVGEFFSDVIKKGEEAQQAQAQLQSVLKSTGGVAGITTQMAEDLAAGWSKVTKFSDDSIVSMENVMLTFTNVRGAAFQGAIPAVLNLATAMHEDLQSAAVQVGKALADPAKGISALHRVGVEFSEVQKEQIKHFVAINDIASAQGIILKELGTEFGGSAEAAGKTFAGQMAILSNRMDLVKEKLFDMLSNSPLVAKAFELASKGVDLFASALDSIADTAQNFNGDAIGGIADLFYKVGYALEGMGVSGANDFFSNLGDMFITVTTDVKKFIQNGLEVLGHWWARNGPAIAAAGEHIFGGIRKLIDDLGPKFKDFIQNILAEFTHWFIVNGPLIARVIQTISVIFTDVLVPAIEIAWSVIEPILQGLFSILLDLATFIMDVFTGNWKDAWEQVKKIGIVAWNSIKTAILNFLEGVAKSMGTSLKQIGDDWRNGWDGMVRTVANAISRAISAVRSTLSQWYSIGKDIIEGIIQGIEDYASQVAATLSNIVSGAVNAVETDLGIHSPSRRFALIGEQMMAGWAQGIHGAIQMPVKVLLQGSSQLTASAMMGSQSSTHNNISNSTNNKSQHFGSVNNFYVNARQSPLETLKILRQS